MKQNKVTCAIRIVLFLGMCHKAANVQEISRGIHMSEGCVKEVLCLLQQAYVLIVDEYTGFYQLQDCMASLTMEDITRIIDGPMERGDMLYESKGTVISG